MGSEWDPHGIRMGSAWDPHGIHMGSKGDPKGIQRGFKDPNTNSFVLRRKKMFSNHPLAFYDDWQQNTNSFVLRTFPNIIWNNKGSKGNPKRIQRESKGDPKWGYPRRLLKSKHRRIEIYAKKLFQSK